MKLHTIVLLLILFGQYLPAYAAESTTTHKIQFLTAPTDAVVCNRIGRREHCHGKTPLALGLSFNNAEESKKFEIRKLGYQRVVVLVTSGSANVDVNLEKQELFPDTSRYQPETLRQLQSKVNLRLGNAIYAYRGLGDWKIQVYGKFGLYQAEDGSKRLKFSILLNSQSTLKELKKASRTRNESQRKRKIMDTLRDSGVFNYFDMVSESMRGLSIDTLDFNVFFSRSKAVLDFEQVNKLKREYAGSTYSSYGGAVYRSDNYNVYTITEDVTVVKDKNVTINYQFLADQNLLLTGKKPDSFNQLDKMVVYSNDNRKNKVKRMKLDN